MTFATYHETTVRNNTSYSTTHNFTLPGTINANDHLFIVISVMDWHGGVTEDSSFDGYTLHYFRSLHNWHSWRIYHKEADGSEDSDVLTFTTSKNARSSANILRFSAVGGDGELGSSFFIGDDLPSRDFTLNPDPPSVSAPWGSGDNTFIALCTTGSTGATYNSGPANYSNLSSGDAAASTIVGSATRQLAAQSDDPGTFSITDGTSGENVQAVSIVVRGDDNLDADPTPKGGITAAGATTATFTEPSGLPQVDSDIKVFWDLDNDGDFNEPEEDITSYVTSFTISAGRDWPSQLTGKSTPGRFSAELTNTNARFSRFNTSSPLNTDPFSLDVGRKLRVQIDGATNPEPDLVAYDRFGGTGGLGDAESGHQWGQVSGGNWTRANGAITADSDAVAVIDILRTTGYFQTRLRHIDPPNSAGIVYRWFDEDDYGLVWVFENKIRHRDVTSGVVTDNGEATIEVRPNMTFGVYVDEDDNATIYVDGVALFTDTGLAHSSSDTGAGVYVTFAAQRCPAFEQFYIWDGLWSTSEGVLSTTDVTKVLPITTAGPRLTAKLEGEGWLRRLAGPEITPPTSIGVTPDSTAGVTSGLMVGASFAAAGMLHPPPPDGISEGIALGGVGTGNAKALFVARSFELPEIGFIYELPEGPIAFDDRDARGARVTKAAVGDGDAQFALELFELLDWRRELFNRVDTEIAPTAATLETTLVSTANYSSGQTATIKPTLPTSGQASAGDLDLMVITPGCLIAGERLETPPGWTAINAPNNDRGNEWWFAKTLTASDFSTTPDFYTASTTGGGTWIARQFIIQNWYGVIESGVAIAEPTGYGDNTESVAQAGTNDPPVLLTPWGRQPTLYITTRSGMHTSSSGSVSATSPDDAPSGYPALTSTFQAGSVSTADTAQQEAHRHAVTTVEDPSSFGGTFTGFDYTETNTVAVRGYAGDPPESSTGEIVTFDDLDSQERHNLINSLPAIAQFFPDQTAAEAYADAILERHGSERPLFRIGFTATKNSHYRYLAHTLRLGDKVRIIGTGASGHGVNGLYHIEHISHQFSDGLMKWWWQAEVSPAN